MRRSFAPILCSLALITAPQAASAHALATVLTAEPVRAGVKVDTTALGNAAEPVENQIQARADQLRLEAEILPSRSPADPTIHVTVTPAEGEDMGYDIAAVIHKDGAPVPDTSLDDRCKLCTEGELVDRVDGHLRTLLEKAQALATDETADTSPEENGDPDASTPAAPLGTPGKAGIGLAAGGVLTLGLGIGLAARADTYRFRDDPERVTTKPPGYALAGIGGALLIAGVALIVVDRVRAKKRKTALVPHASPQGAGVTFVARF